MKGEFRDPSPFQRDLENDRPLLRLETDKALDGFEIIAFGSDDSMANTLFAVIAGGERVLTRHPEPLLVRFIADIVEAGAFTLEVGDENVQEVELTDGEKRKLMKVEKELYKGLEDAPP